MTVTLDLPAEAQARLEAEASRRGITLNQLIAELAAGLPAGTTPRRKRAFVGLGSSTTGRGAREADQMLAEGFGRN